MSMMELSSEQESQNMVHDNLYMGLSLEQDFQKMGDDNLYHNILSLQVPGALKVAHDIFGTDITSLKGIVVRQKPGGNL